MPNVLNAKTVARSVWIHIQCAYKPCEKWFALEDSDARFAYCPHCRALLTIEENSNASNSVDKLG